MIFSQSRSSISIPPAQDGRMSFNMTENTFKTLTRQDKISWINRNCTANPFSVISAAKLIPIRDLSPHAAQRLLFLSFADDTRSGTYKSIMTDGYSRVKASLEAYVLPAMTDDQRLVYKIMAGQHRWKATQIIFEQAEAGDAIARDRLKEFYEDNCSMPYFELRHDTPEFIVDFICHFMNSDSDEKLGITMLEILVDIPKYFSVLRNIREDSQDACSRTLFSRSYTDYLAASVIQQLEWSRKRACLLYDIHIFLTPESRAYLKEYATYHQAHIMSMHDAFETFAEIAIRVHSDEPDFMARRSIG
jgi:hypothetical protein